MSRRKLMPEERLIGFWSYVSKGTESQCWPWKGAIRSKRADQGYGVYKWADRMEVSHRIAWMLVNGTIPPGLSVLHECDNPPCCNPKHLFLGTQLDNMRDRNAKGRANFARGERHHWAKLTEEKVRQIRATTGRVADVALQFGCSPATVSFVRLRRIWKHVV